MLTRTYTECEEMDMQINENIIMLGMTLTPVFILSLRLLSSNILHVLPVGFVQVITPPKVYSCLMSSLHKVDPRSTATLKMNE